MTQRARWSAALAALALATAGRIALVHHLADQGFFAKYIFFADRILAGSIPRTRIGDLSPAYLWLVTACRAMHMSVAAMRDAQIAALSIAALLCAMAARHIGGPLAAFTAAVLILANRAALVTATELEPETLIVLLLSAALAAIVGWERTPRVVVIAAGGLLVGLAITARPVAAAALVLIAIWIALRDRRAALAFVAAALLPIAIVLFVNRAVTGSMSIMEPGTGLYDGNNPLANGCAGVMPRIIADLDRSAAEPDYLHVAYRIVAGRATGSAPDARSGNRYWAAKAIAWMRAEPAAAAHVLAMKALLSIHSYDVYDLATTWQKAGELSGWPFVPFGALTALAAAAIVLRRGRRDLVTVSLFALASCGAMIAFNVSSRQRDALLPPLAILAATGVAEIAARRGLKLAIAIGAVIAGALLLQTETNLQREDTYGWSTSVASSRMRDAARVSVLRTAEPPLVDASTLRTVALTAANAEEPLRFDAAIALEKAGAWREADAVLATLADYAPQRDNHAVSSVAFYRARAALHLGRDPRPLIARAMNDTPGDPNVLALASVAGDRDALRRLDLLHDPFTRDYTLAWAWLDTGDRQRAFALRDRLLRQFPEWQRPRSIR